MSNKLKTKNDQRKILSARRRYRISQEQLGDMVGVSRGTIGRWESGATKIPNWAARKIADIFGSLWFKKPKLDKEPVKPGDSL